MTRRDKGFSRNPAAGRVPAAPPTQPLQPTPPRLPSRPPVPPATQPLAPLRTQPPHGDHRPPLIRPPLTRPTPNQPVVLPRPAVPTRDRPSAWHFLLVIPVLVPLATPFYNRLEPRLLGMPFFYWGQVASVLFAMAITMFVFQVTKRRF